MDKTTSNKLHPVGKNTDLFVSNTVSSTVLSQFPVSLYHMKHSDFIQKSLSFVSKAEPSETLLKHSDVKFYKKSIKPFQLLKFYFESDHSFVGTNGIKFSL